MLETHCKGDIHSSKTVNILLCRPYNIVYALPCDTVMYVGLVLTVFGAAPKYACTAPLYALASPVRAPGL